MSLKLQSSLRLSPYALFIQALSKSATLHNSSTTSFSHTSPLSQHHDLPIQHRIQRISELQVSEALDLDQGFDPQKQSSQAPTFSQNQPSSCPPNTTLPITHSTICVRSLIFLLHQTRLFLYQQLQPNLRAFPSKSVMVNLLLLSPKNLNCFSSYASNAPRALSSIA